MPGRAARRARNRQRELNFGHAHHWPQVGSAQARRRGRDAYGGRGFSSSIHDGCVYRHVIHRSTPDTDWSAGRLPPETGVHGHRGLESIFNVACELSEAR